MNKLFSRTFAAFSLALLVTVNAHLEARDHGDYPALPKPPDDELTC